MNRLLILTLLLLMALTACSEETPDVEEPTEMVATETAALPTLEATGTVAESYPAPATVIVQSYPEPPIATPDPYAAPATTIAIETPESVVPPITATVAIEIPEGALLSTATVEISVPESPVAATEITIDATESEPTATVEGDNLEIEEPQATTIAIEEAESPSEPTPEPVVEATAAPEVEPTPEPEAVMEATAAPEVEQGFPAACGMAPEARLATLLQSQIGLAEGLGCPIGEAEQTWAAWALFEQDNQMVWLQNQDLIFAIYDDFWHGYEDTYEEGEPEVPAGAPLPSKAGHMIPIRGFGKVWIQISEQMGFAVSEEAGYDATLQRFENGWLLTTPYGQVLALLELTDNPLSQAPVQSWLERDGEWVGE